jgi:hypothetical protein
MFSVIEITSMIVMGILMLAAILIIASQKVLIKRYRCILKCYCEILHEASTKEDVVLKYCLHHILKESVDTEDYETAGKCRELLQKIYSQARVRK